MIRHKKLFIAIALVHFLITIAAMHGTVVLSIGPESAGTDVPEVLLENAGVFYSVFLLFSFPLLLVWDIVGFAALKIPYVAVFTILILAANSAFVSYLLVFIVERLRRASRFDFGDDL